MLNSDTLDRKMAKIYTFKINVNVNRKFLAWLKQSKLL